MRRFLAMSGLGIGMILSCAFWALAQEEKPAYIGVKKCKICHKTEKQGRQFGKWEASKHAKAYAALGTPEAKEMAAERGVHGDPQKAPECLKCHVTAFGVDPSLIQASFKIEDGVQCETCHGPGSKYKGLKVMKDHEASLKAGLIVPNEKLCLQCHNEESPTYQEFVYKERVEEISHPVPEKKE